MTALLDAIVPPDDDLRIPESDRPIEVHAGGARPIGPAPHIVETDVEAEMTDAVILIAEAFYHVDELGPLHDERVSCGVKTRFMLAPQTVDSARIALGEFTDQVLPFAPELVGVCAGVVTLNDWGRLQRVISVANDAGIPTFAKVEGVQDFDDADTGRVRRPYRTAAVILGQGENDAQALPGQHVAVVEEAIGWSGSGTRRRCCPAPMFSST